MDTEKMEYSEAGFACFILEKHGIMHTVVHGIMRTFVQRENPSRLAGMKTLPTQDTTHQRSRGKSVSPRSSRHCGDGVKASRHFLGTHVVNIAFHLTTASVSVTTFPVQSVQRQQRPGGLSLAMSRQSLSHYSTRQLVSPDKAMRRAPGTSRAHKPFSTHRPGCPYVSTTTPTVTTSHDTE